MPTAADLSLIKETRNTFLFVGSSGDGKTCASYSFPTPMYHYDLDKRWKGVMGHPKIVNDLERLKATEIVQFDLNNWDKHEVALDLLKIKAMKPQDFPWKTVLWDGFSTTSDLAITFALKLTGVGGKDISRKIAGKNIAGWDEYGYEHTVFREICLKLKMLPCNVIITAHWVDDYDDKGQKSGKKVNLRDKIMASVCKYFDEVYHFSKVDGPKGPRHVVKFRSTLARTSFLNLPNEIDWTGENFYDVWLKLVQGEKS